MGIVKKVLLEKEIPVPDLNRRLTVELCENVHLHYRNLRLEFKADEFAFLLRALREISPEYVENFEFGEDEFEAVVYTNELPDETYFNRRLRIEEQQGGHYHVHYRNLRIEVNDLKEVGIETKTS